MKRVLVIEDNDDNMELITFILEANGYQTIRAWNGWDGVHTASQESPDFIILDIQLPDILGTEVLRQLRLTDRTRAIPVIAMTSFAMAGDRERLLSAGCNGYIEKPIDPGVVMQQIEKALRKTP